MSNWYSQPDPRIPAEREDDGWRDDERGWARHELARAAELATRLGNCPERKQDVEAALLNVAGLEEFNLAA